jgi:large subunit ribosomal protein L6
MSRIGKKAIILSKNIDAVINNNIVTIKGPKGEQSQKISELIHIVIEESTTIKVLRLSIQKNLKAAPSLYGLSRTLIDNMITGVTIGFSKYLEIQGVGYRSQMDGNKLILNVGYSHSIIITPPKEVIIKVENNINIIISGINKEVVGQVASNIRSIRPPEPYKGKGIRYKGEIVKKKVGKTGK